MKKILILIFCLFNASLIAFGETVLFGEAIHAKKISVKISGLGGYQGACVSAEIKNNTTNPLSIKIPEGIIFTNKDSTEQDLMTVENYLLVLNPSEKKTQQFQTMCIKQNAGSPSINAVFVYKKNAAGNLLAMASLIAEKNYQNSTGQAAVWAISNNLGLESIYAEDTLMARDLLNLASKLTGKPIPVFVPMKPHYIYSVKICFAHHFSKPTKVTLACFNEEGTLVKEFYKNKAVPMGMYIASISQNFVSDKGTVYYYRVIDSEGKVVKEKKVTESIIEENARQWRLDIAFSYTLDTAITNATMTLYDEEGNLMETLYTNRSIPAGIRNQKYSLNHAYGKNRKFTMKLTDGTGKVILEKQIDTNASVPVTN